MLLIDLVNQMRWLDDSVSFRNVLLLAALNTPQINISNPAINHDHFGRFAICKSEQVERVYHRPGRGPIQPHNTRWTDFNSSPVGAHHHWAIQSNRGIYVKIFFRFEEKNSTAEVDRYFLSVAKVYGCVRAIAPDKPSYTLSVLTLTAQSFMMLPC